MNKYLKTSIYFMLFALVMQLVPPHVLANSYETTSEDVSTEVLLYSTNENESIELYEDVESENLVFSIPDGALVEIIDAQEEYSEVRYTDELASEDSEVTIWTGFVRSFHMISISDKDDFLEKRQDPDFNLEEYYSDSEAIEDQEELIVEDVENGIDEDEVDEIESNSKEQEPATGEATDEISDDNTLDDSDENATKDLSILPATATTNLEGVALKDSTKVYSKMSESSSVLKSYKQGHILKFQSHTSDWYIATVYINGKPQTGYINVSDVDLLKEQEGLRGFSLVQPVSVYASPTRNSSVLKSYNYGHVLIYRSFSSQWHQATVFVNGKAHTGYIQANDVGPEITLKGIATANTVSVYSATSRNSTKLKTYNEGHILIYRSFTSSWHKATVYVNGKAHTGYIHTNDVEDAFLVQSSLSGIGTKSSTHVYSSASTKSSVLKSYHQGHVLKYRTFSPNWYEATVIINGRARTGYIYKNDVEEITNRQQAVRGIATKSPTRIYSRASTGAPVVKSYPYASNLVYRTFTANWYQATVYVNGKARTGYIHKNDVMTTSGKVIVLDPGHGGADPGARALGIVEKNLNLDIALRTRNLMEKAGFTVIMTRTSDVFIPLAGRAAIANNSNADIFISIHGNSFNGNTRGIESFWYGKYEKERSIKLANSMQSNLVRSMGIPHRRVAEGNFHVIRETKIPSTLVEVGFIDHPSDAAKLKQAKYKQHAAEGILFGALDYFK